MRCGLLLALIGYFGVRFQLYFALLFLFNFFRINIFFHSGEEDRIPGLPIILLIPFNYKIR